MDIKFEYYFDWLPDELLYIICEYLKTDTSLTKVSDRYKCIYERYIKLVHDGFINLFDILHTNNIKILTYYIEICNEDYPEEIVGNNFLSSTSNYFKVHSPESELLQVHVPMISNKHIIELSPQIIYIRECSKNYIDHYNIVDRCYVYIINNKYKLVLTTKCLSSNSDIKDDGLESEKWKDIWDKLDIQDRNAILYQNGFPLRWLN